MNAEAIKLPNMIQRIKQRWEPPRDGKGAVDANFSFDYMGSSEFEYGALPETLKEMRANPKDVIFEKIEHRGHKAYYVGPLAGLPIAVELFRHELDTPFPYTGFTQRFKEVTNIKDSYPEPTTTDTQKKKYRKSAQRKQERPNYSACIGWWAVCTETPFAIFKNDPDARLWKDAIYGASKERLDKMTEKDA